MLTLLVKAPLIPIIQASRLTAVGMQYTIATPDYLDFVTANGEQLTCTCGESACIHLQAVQCQRARNATMNARRDIYTTLFDLSTE